MLDNKSMANGYKDLKRIFEIQIRSSTDVFLCIITKHDIDLDSDVEKQILSEIKARIENYSTWYSYMIRQNIINERMCDSEIEVIVNNDRLKWLDERIEFYSKKSNDNQ